MQSIMELRCALQQYEWGKLGETSEAALLSKAANPNFEIISHKPYAELWMGTHPNGPSYLSMTGESLEEWIQKNPQTLGDRVLKVFGIQLPFLFKVLSVNKALSIQAHPTKVVHFFTDFYNYYRLLIITIDYFSFIQYKLVYPQLWTMKKIYV